MAGSFFHLWLAEQAFSKVGIELGDDDEYRAAFAAGSIAPDIGFFPGGPFAFSHRVHIEQSGDFLRALIDRATSEREKAFAAGWGLHVYTDMAVHPWVEASVAESLARGLEPAIAGLWHMRLEWGIDCRLLALKGVDSLWNPALYFPRREEGESLLGEVGKAFYGTDGAKDSLARGEAAALRWLHRIPKILWWGGHTRAVGLRPNPWCVFVFSRLGRRLVGDLLERWAYFKDAAALARPQQASDEIWGQVVALGESALEGFLQGLAGSFTQLGNPDLYTGLQNDD